MKRLLTSDPSSMLTSHLSMPVSLSREGSAGRALKTDCNACEISMEKNEIKQLRCTLLIILQVNFSITFPATFGGE